MHVALTRRMGKKDKKRREEEEEETYFIFWVAEAIRGELAT